MKWLTAFLLLLLIVSISLNVFLWQNSYPPQDPRHPPKLDGQAPEMSGQAPYPVDSTEAIKFNKDSLSEKQMVGQKAFVNDINSVTGRAKNKNIHQVKQWLAAGEMSIARDFIQQYLRKSPSDIEFLMLEAELLMRTTSPGDVLVFYYSLLDYPLTTDQRATILRAITEIVGENVEKLKSIKAWDILATFLEPLWQFDPTKRSYILHLAEAYARQRDEYLMENVLASLPPGDLDAVRIRQILPLSSLSREDLQVESDQAKAYQRSVRLKRIGDHFITDVFIDRNNLNLMIDTGATTTVLTQNAFASLNDSDSASYVGSYKVTTAGGQFVAPIYQFKRVFMAGFKLENVAIVVLPMEDFSAADGLLGMNLLREFDFKLDQENDLLLLNRL